MTDGHREVLELILVGSPAKDRAKRPANRVHETPARLSEIVGLHGQREEDH